MYKGGMVAVDVWSERMRRMEYASVECEKRNKWNFFCDYLREFQGMGARLD